jgi:pimeloyl-ACP methyl ester carboxylesterase
MTAYAVVCGSGSSGLAWEPVAGDLGALVLPAPDAPDVPAMAAALAPAIAMLPRPRVLIGTSLGALIALELARTLPVDALVLVSAGFGIAVHPAVLEQITAGGPGLLDRMARGVVADPGDAELVAEVRRDFEGCGADVLLRHMEVLARHRPRLPAILPPTFVIWGTRDPGVPLAAQADLAARCGAPLLPVPDAGHLPYLEQPGTTLDRIRMAVRWAGVDQTTLWPPSTTSTVPVT